MDLKLEENIGMPYVMLSIDDKVFEISGDSYSPNVINIYNQILKWIDSEINKLTGKLVCKFHFSVFSTVTKKKMVEIIYTLNEHQDKGKEIEIIWIYDKFDEDSMAIAEDLIELFDIPIKKVELDI